MDKHAEVEAKFEITARQDDLEMAMNEILRAPEVGGARYQTHRYIDMSGTDSFYRIGKKVFRYRSDSISKQIDYGSLGSYQVRMGGSDDKEFRTNQFLLTVKERKTNKNLLNRHEVDVPLLAEKGDFEAFMSMLEIEPWYQIKKEYKIWQLGEQNGIKVCVAMYNVSRPDGSEHKRFLEVEIEKDSTCSPKQGMVALKKWITYLRENLKLDPPTNQSLSELYCPKEKE